MTKDWIQSISGRKFFPLAPRSEDIVIADIAGALSKNCRYTGQCSRFYSVAEHSYLVSRRAEEIAYIEITTPEYAKRAAQWGLLHDASEAYIADVSRPLKQTQEFAAYRAVEKRLQMAIIEKFGLSPMEPHAVGRADHEILSFEAHQIKQPLHPEWALEKPIAHTKFWRDWECGLAPEDAEHLFLLRFEELFGEAK